MSSNLGQNKSGNGNDLGSIVKDLKGVVDSVVHNLNISSRDGFTQATARDTYLDLAKKGYKVSLVAVVYNEHESVGHAWTFTVPFGIGFINYKVYVYLDGVGRFIKKGDGGYINWCVYGNFTRTGNIVEVEPCTYRGPYYKDVEVNNTSVAQIRDLVRVEPCTNKSLIPKGIEANDMIVARTGNTLEVEKRKKKVTRKKRTSVNNVNTNTNTKTNTININNLNLTIQM